MWLTERIFCEWVARTSETLTDASSLLLKEVMVSQVLLQFSFPCVSLIVGLLLTLRTQRIECLMKVTITQLAG